MATEPPDSDETGAETVCGGGGCTVSVVEPATDPTVAEMVAVPCPTEVARPEDEIVATE